MGGLIGYQLKSLQLIIANTSSEGNDAPGVTREAGDARDAFEGLQQVERDGGASPVHCAGDAEVRYHVPPALDLAGEGGRRVGARAAAHGILAMPFMAEILPVGGEWGEGGGWKGCPHLGWGL